MSKCVNAEDLIAFMEGELSFDEAKRIDQHLDQCSECANLANHWATLQKALPCAAKCDFSETFTDDVMHRIAPNPDTTYHKKLLRHLIEYQVQLASLVFAVLLIMFQQRPELNVNTDMVLLSSFSQASSVQLLSDQNYTTTDLFDFSLEDL